MCTIELGLPDVDSLDVLRKLQEMGVASIVVTGRGDVTDRALGRAEAHLLEVLARASNRVLSREYILDAIGAASTFDRRIDVRVSRLRQKVERDPQNTEIIRTVSRFWLPVRQQRSVDATR